MFCKTSIVFLLVLFAAAVLAAGNNTPQPNVMLGWAQVMQTAVANSVSSGLDLARSRWSIRNRFETIVDTCAYDAWAVYDNRALPFPDIGISYRIHGSNADQVKAINYAVYRALKHEFRLFPGNLDAFFDDHFVNVLGLDPDDTNTNVDNPAGVGNYIAQKVTEYWSHDQTNSDGSEPSGNGHIFSDHTGYRPLNDPFPEIAKTDCSLIRDINHWQPATISGHHGPAPQVWHDIQFSYYNLSFAAPAQVWRPPPPPRYGTGSNQQFVDNFQEILSVSGTLNDEQKALAVFWIRTPHRQFVIDAIIQGQLNLEQTVKYLFVTSHAVNDGNIVQLESKRFFDYARPTAVVQCLNAGQTVTGWKGPYQGTGSMPGSSWTPYYPTFIVDNYGGQYPCGHCIMGSNLAEASRLFFNSDDFVGVDYVIPEGGSFIEPKVTNPLDPRFVNGVTNVPNSGHNTVGYAPAQDIPIHFDSWTDLEDKCGVSRLYLGVHEQWSITQGKVIGKRVANAVWNKATELFNAKYNHWW